MTSSNSIRGPDQTLGEYPPALGPPERKPYYDIGPSKNTQYAGQLGDKWLCLRGLVRSASKTGIYYPHADFATVIYNYTNFSGCGQFIVLKRAGCGPGARPPHLTLHRATVMAHMGSTTAKKGPTVLVGPNLRLMKSLCKTLLLTQECSRSKIHALQGLKAREDRLLASSPSIVFSNMLLTYHPCNNDSPSGHAPFEPGLGSP